MEGNVLNQNEMVKIFSFFYMKKEFGDFNSNQFIIGNLDFSIKTDYVYKLKSYIIKNSHTVYF